MCLLGVDTSLGSERFDIPAVIQSVCLEASDQVGAEAKGFELITRRCRSSIFIAIVKEELQLAQNAFAEGACAQVINISHYNERGEEGGTQ